MKRASLFANVLVVALVTTAQAQPITYNLDASALPGDPYVLTGFITTDGALGSISSTDIVSFGLSLTTLPTSTIDVTGTFSGIHDAAIDATSASLTFQIYSPDYGPTFIQLFNQSNNLFDIYSSGPGTVTYAISDPSADTYTHTFSTESDFVFASAAAVPEPSSMLLTLMGVGAAYGWHRMRRGKQAEQSQSSPEVHF